MSKQKEIICRSDNQILVCEYEETGDELHGAYITKDKRVFFTTDNQKIQPTKTAGG